MPTHQPLVPRDYPKTQTASHTRNHCRHVSPRWSALWAAQPSLLATTRGKWRHQNHDTPMTRRQTDPNAAKPPLPLIGRHNVTHNENSMRMEHDASAFIVGLNQVQYRLSLTNKPKSCHKTHTFCPLTLVLAHPHQPCSTRNQVDTRPAHTKNRHPLSDAGLWWS